MSDHAAPTRMSRLANAIKTLVTRRMVFVFDRVEFTYEKLSYKRLWNWFKTELGYVLHAGNLASYPTLLQVEPANVCNLRCPLCHVVTDNKPRGMMRFDNYKALMDEVGDYMFFLHLWGWGEPFLNPDIYRMIWYAKQKGLQIISSTNGHLFDNDQTIDWLINSGLDVLIFAIDGLDQETYEQYRKQGNLSKVLGNLRRILERRNELGSATPRINLRMLVTRDNEEQVPRMHELARELGVDMLSFKTLCSFDKPDLWNTMLPVDPQFRRFTYDASGQPVRVLNSCKKPWNHPTVYRDGLVVPCDYFTGEDFSLGRAFDPEHPELGSHFREVWNGETFRQMRSQFNQKMVAPRCEDCSLNYAGVDMCVSHMYAYGEQSA